MKALLLTLTLLTSAALAQEGAPNAFRFYGNIDLQSMTAESLEHLMIVEKIDGCNGLKYGHLRNLLLSDDPAGMIAVVRRNSTCDPYSNLEFWMTEYGESLTPAAIEALKNAQ